MIFLKPAPAFAGDQVRRTTIFLCVPVTLNFLRGFFFLVSHQIGAALITISFLGVIFMDIHDQKVKFFMGLSDYALAWQYLDLSSYDTYSANEDRLICGEIIIDRFLKKNIYSKSDS